MPTYPPKKNPLSTSGGGVGIPPIPKKKRFSQILPIFACSECHLRKAIPRKWRHIFKKKESFLFIIGLRTKTSSIFSKGATSWENRNCLSASFFGFLVFLLQSRFCESCYGKMEENLENPKEVFIQHMPFYNNLFQFFPRCHNLRGTNVCVGLVFAEIRPIFHGGQFRIFGDSWLFLAEVVESNFWNLWGDLSYL